MMVNHLESAGGRHSRAKPKDDPQALYRSLASWQSSSRAGPPYRLRQAGAAQRHDSVQNNGGRLPASGDIVRTPVDRAAPQAPEPSIKKKTDGHRTGDQQR